MKRLIIIFIFLNAFLLVSAQVEVPVSVISNDTSFDKLFRAGDNIYLQIKSDSCRVRIIADTKSSTGQSEIIHSFSKEATDTINAGTFPTTGLYLVKSTLAKRSNDYEYVSRDSILAWQKLWYIYYQIIGNTYFGYHWKDGTDDIIGNASTTYLYSYSPGKDFTKSDASVIEVHSTTADSSSADAQSIISFSDSLSFALKNVNKDSLKRNIEDLNQSLSGKIDSGKLYRFSFYLPLHDSLRLLITDNLDRVDTSRVICKAIMQSLLNCFKNPLNSNLTRIGNDGEIIKIPVISSNSTLNKIIESIFNYSTASSFYRIDEDNPEYSLISLDTTYQPNSSGITAEIVENNASEQIIISAKIVGTKTTNIKL